MSRGGTGTHSPESRRRKAGRIACALGPACDPHDCRRCELGYHCGEHSAGCHQACGIGRAADHPVAFQVYRRDAPVAYQEAGLALPPDQVQFEGVVFTDGTCVIRWRTKIGSTCTFRSFAEMMAVHGHPEYDTAIRWITDLGAAEPWEGSLNDSDLPQLPEGSRLG